MAKSPKSLFFCKSFYPVVNLTQKPIPNEKLNYKIHLLFKIWITNFFCDTCAIKTELNMIGVVTYNGTIQS